MAWCDPHLLMSRLGQELLRSWGKANLAAPIVIGGTGGSGTRAVQALLERAGTFMGRDVNAAGDAMPFEPLQERWTNPVLEARRSLSYRVEDLPGDLRRRVRREFRVGMRRYLADLPHETSRWGWKNPRSIYILPFIHAMFPRMYFVHVLRDGRDMAISANQNQYRKHYASLFADTSERDDVVESCRMWARTNNDAADWGETTLGRRYVQLRLEDLCASPCEVAARLLDALGIDAECAQDAAQELMHLPTIGRWQVLPADLRERVTATAALALRRFGYHRIADHQLPR